MTEHDHEGEFEQGVMVDVGHGRGALVIYAPDELRGQEIEISPVGLNSQRVHASVLRRRMTNGQVSAVVFGSSASFQSQDGVSKPLSGVLR